MMPVTTARIHCDLALQDSCGQQCVDWAIGMLETGHETHSLLRLAGMLPPHNHFEIAELTDRALDELGISRKPEKEAVIEYAIDVLNSALAGKIDLLQATETVAGLHIAIDYSRELTDFYMLYYAHLDLQYDEVQWYWDGATRDNIVEIIRERASEFVRTNRENV